ncbi:MAG: SpoIIE family protein phosphatase, partial [Planctomycetes bacterium]|nr:SpoIIE family protein phosphatase [Planctomycetota bacterium]
MMKDDNHPGGSLDAAAESTHFRVAGRAQDADAFPERRRSAESYHGAGNSIRLHTTPSRGGLAMKLTVPILVSMLAGLFVVLLVIRTRMYNLQLRELEADTANTTFVTGMFGRLLILHRDRFLAENPGYNTSQEWQSGAHWLVTEGFVSPEIWAAETGFDPEEYAPAAVLEKAAERTILSTMTQWINSPIGGLEIVAVYLLNADRSVYALGHNANATFDPAILRAAPVSPAFTEAGDIRVHIDYLADAEPEPLVRGVARLYTSGTPRQYMGSVVVVVRTAHLLAERNAFLARSLVLAAILALCMTVICWYAARRVTGTIRKLAADMQAMAEGDYTRRSGITEGGELGQLAQAFDSMAERLRVARTNEKENNRLESDLAIARSIQNNLLPLQTPRVRGLDIHTAYRPAKEIGGDYFDFLPVDSQHMGIVVADASGKSIPAALVMSTTRAILRFVAPGSLSAAETLTRTNAILSVDIPKGMFVTAYYVILDPLNNTLLCASAGHTPLLIARCDGSVEQLNPGGIALGFDGGPIFQRSIREKRITLDKGDRVLLYTDGVVECVNPANEEYSERRLREFLRRNRDLSSHDFVGALMTDLDRHRSAADMRAATTVVTVKGLESLFVAEVGAGE